MRWTWSATAAWLLATAACGSLATARQAPTTEETAQQQAAEEQIEQAEVQPTGEQQSEAPEPQNAAQQRAAQRQAAQRQQQQEAQRQRQAQEPSDDETEDDSPAAESGDEADDDESRPQRRRAQFRSSDEEGRNRDRGEVRREDRDDEDRGDDRVEDDGNQRESRQWETGIAFDTDPQERLLISELEDDAVLARAGLRRGDVILSINGRDITSEEDFLRWIHISRPDRPIAFVVWRDGAEEQLFVDVFRFDGRDQVREENRQSDDGQSDDGQRATLGVVLDVRWENAAVVESVFEGSPADKAGLRPGDQIVRFNGRRVGSPLQLIDLVAQRRAGDEVEIEIARRVTRSLSVALDSREAFGDEAVRYAEQPRQDGRLNGDRDDDDDRDDDRDENDDDDIDDMDDDDLNDRDDDDDQELDFDD